MQILGKSSKLLLIAVAIVMLVAIGISFAAWDSMSAVKASNVDLSSYANSKVGDVIKFGKYYQTLEKDIDGEYIKTPIEWIVVDKDERTGELTLMSKYILACGSYFGNRYAASGVTYSWNYSGSTSEVGNIPGNQAYADSTVRAYLNNLERLDMGGDGFTDGVGYVPTKRNSTLDTGLLSSVGFSDQRYWTGISYSNAANKALVDAGNKGLFKRFEEGSNEIYFQRPINNIEYKNRPVTRGFYNSAFNDEEKNIIKPKVIAGYTGHRWPCGAYDISTKSYVEGTVDKVWLPSATELNIMNGKDWNQQSNDSWTNPSDEASSTVFEYFKNLKDDALIKALRTVGTPLAKDAVAGNYSIPVYDIGTTTPKTEISKEPYVNVSDNYWTRSPMSHWSIGIRTVLGAGLFHADNCYDSYIGVRPCVILTY